MTIVTKRIGGIDYLYYQDSIIGVDGQRVTVSSYIGRSDFDAQQLAKGVAGGLSVHLEKIVNSAKIASPYKFATAPAAPFDNVLLLEKIRFVHEYISRNTPAAQVGEVERSLFVAYVHGTTAIEGNTLSAGETEKLLYADLTPANKSRNEILEVSNYTEAQAYIDRYSGDIDLNFIKRIHAMLMTGIRGKDERLYSAGKFRKDHARVTGASFRPSAPDDIEKHLEDLMAEYHAAKERGIHPAELASTFHQRFEKIHPFADGNGRTGRALLNFILVKRGLPRLLYILPAHRTEYLRALQEADYGNNAPLVDFIIRRMIAAVTYFYAKTSAYDALVLPQMQKLFMTLYGENVAGIILTRLDDFRESGEFP